MILQRPIPPTLGFRPEPSQYQDIDIIPGPLAPLEPSDRGERKQAHRERQADNDSANNQLPML